MFREAIMSKQRVSLHDELLEIGYALDGIHLLAHLVSADGFDEPGADDRGIRGAEALLAVLRSRINLICACIRGEVSTRLLRAPHNSWRDENDGGPQDVLLPLKTRK